MKAVIYLHQQGLYYGDMKGANLLVFRDGKVKLGDLGICIKTSNNKAKTYPIKGGTEGYLNETV